ncbi:MAG: hypothetical protein IKN42_06275, partial [Elusimicrobia bacterium]|nr:hypothetical protein [Elusimicrobiota bacterium]
MVSLFVFITSVGFAITNNDVNEKKVELKNIPQDKALKKAKNYYFDGDFEKAEEYVDQILANFG